VAVAAAAQQWQRKHGGSSSAAAWRQHGGGSAAAAASLEAAAEAALRQRRPAWWQRLQLGSSVALAVAAVQQAECWQCGQQGQHWGGGRGALNEVRRGREEWVWAKMFVIDHA
jgi:hypothetical protein